MATHESRARACPRVLEIDVLGDEIALVGSSKWRDRSGVGVEPERRMRCCELE
jgi:hypothetical protein